MSKIELGGFIFFLIFLLLSLSGCASDRYVVMVPPCPVRPSLPLVMETELTSLTDDAYSRLVERELILLDYIGELKTLCRE